MKKLGIILVCIATLAMSSCSLFQSAASSNSAAMTLGQTCGSAVLSLYRSYKATGSLSLATGDNLTNALALATCYTQLSQNKDNSDYRKSFTNGLILSSAGLITNQNSNAFVNALLGTSTLGTLNSSSNTAQINKTTPAVTGLLQTLD